MFHTIVLMLYSQLDGVEDTKKTLEQLNKQIYDMENTLQRIAAPNMKALEK
jgi:structural maintenance of chromosome 1